MELVRLLVKDVVHAFRFRNSKRIIVMCFKCFLHLRLNYAAIRAPSEISLQCRDGYVPGAAAVSSPAARVPGAQARCIRGVPTLRREPPARGVIAENSQCTTVRSQHATQTSVCERKRVRFAAVDDVMRLPARAHATGLCGRDQAEAMRMGVLLHARTFGWLGMSSR